MISLAWRSGLQARQVVRQLLGEDFGRFGKAWSSPCTYWFVGGCAPELYDKALQAGEVEQLPGPHSPFWAPALHPTLRTGIETMLTAAGVWLAGPEGD